MQEFDHTVEVRDPKSGRVIAKNDYIMRCGPMGREYERPPGSGMIYDPTGKMIRDEYKTKREEEALKAAQKAEADKAAKLAAMQAEKDEFMASSKAEIEALRAQVLANAQREADAIKAEAAKAPKGK